MNKFTKIISVMLAVVLVIMAIPFTTFAAQKGDVDGNGTITATDARLILRVVAGLQTEADLKNADAADVDSKNGITAVDARIVLRIVAGLQEAPSTPSEPSTPTEPSEPSTPTLPTEYNAATVAAFLNAETAKAAKGTYNWARACNFSKDIDVGGATNTLNDMIQRVDPNADLNSVVGGFLGVGNAKGTKADAGKYALIAMKLTESDIKSFTRGPQSITIYLNDSTNPSNGGNTTFNHVSNDFVTVDDVKNSISEVTTAITVQNCTFTYKDVKVVGRIDANGVTESLEISYTLSATMGLKAFVNINGSGEVKTTIEYTNLKY